MAPLQTYRKTDPNRYRKSPDKSFEMVPPQALSLSESIPVSLADAIPEDAVFARSDAFRGMLEEALKNGTETLTPAQQKQVKMAREQFPKVDERFRVREDIQLAERMINEGREALTVDERKRVQRLRNIIPEVESAFRQLRPSNQHVASIKEVMNDALVEFAVNADKPWTQQAYSTAKAFLQGLEETEAGLRIGEVSRGPGVRVADILGGGKPISEHLEDAFEAVGLQPYKEGDQVPVQVNGFVLKDEDGNYKMRDISDTERIARNMAIGMVRLAPELLVGLMEDPAEFVKSLVTLPFQQAELLVQAADWHDIESGGVLTAFREPFTEQEVQEAREALIQNPLGPIMAALLTLGVAGKVGKGFKPKTRTVPMKRFEAATKEFEKGAKDLKQAEAKVSAAEESAKVFEDKFNEADRINKSLTGKEGLKEKLAAEEAISQRESAVQDAVKGNQKFLEENRKFLEENKESMSPEAFDKAMAEQTRLEGSMTALDEQLSRPVKLEPEKKPTEVTEAADAIQKREAEKVPVQKQAEGGKEAGKAPEEIPKEVKRAEIIEAEELAPIDRAALEAVGEEIKPGGQRGLGITNVFKSLSEKFEQKLTAAQKKRGETDLAPPPSFVVERQPKDVGPSSQLRTPSNVFGIAEGQPHRYGDAAAAAAREIILTDRDIMVKTGIKDEAVADLLAKVDKKDYGKDWSNFFDHVENPKLDHELTPASRDVAVAIRKKMEKDRGVIISRRRDRLRPSIEIQVNRQYRAEKDLAGKTLTVKQKAERDALVETELAKRIPDNWGIDDYMPHMQFGDFRVFVEEGGNPRMIGAARTTAEALDVAMDHYANNPHLTPELYFTKGKAYAGDATVRIPDWKYGKILNDLAEAADGALSRDQVAQFLSGKIGRKGGKQKFAGFLQQRTGTEGYSKDLPRVLSTYNQVFTRWEHLTDMNQKVAPIIEKIRNEGRPRSADYLQSMVDGLWGKSNSKASQLVDSWLQQTPWLQDHIRPLALERWSNALKTGSVWGFLKMNPRFHFLNRWQRTQTLWPMVSTAEWQSGLKLYKSAEGKAILEKNGIRQLTGGKALEVSAGKPITKGKTREAMGRWAAETSNQEIAYLTMYDRARKVGLPNKAANDYAFINGNLRSQFVGLKSDQPPLFKGPFLSVAFMFRRFQVKNLELGYDLIASKDYPGSAKWLTSQLLLGGAKSFARVGQAAGIGYLSLEAYSAVKEELGETMADMIAFGLPSLINLDMSYSITPFDVPYGSSVPEKIGNLFLGPPGQTALKVGRAVADTKGKETSAIKRGAVAALQAIPAGKSVVAALAFIDAGKTWGDRWDAGEYDFRDPAGRLKFRGDLTDVITKAFGGRTMNEAQMELFLDAFVEVQAERDKIVDYMTAQALQLHDGDIEEMDYTKLEQWNELYPDFQVNNEQIFIRARNRYKTLDLDRLQRVMRGGGKQLRSAPDFREKNK